MYTCDHCNYSTKDSSNFKRHLQSKRHKLKSSSNDNNIKPKLNNFAQSN